MPIGQERSKRTCSPSAAPTKVVIPALIASWPCYQIIKWWIWWLLWWWKCFRVVIIEDAFGRCLWLLFNVFRSLQYYDNCDNQQPSVHPLWCFFLLWVLPSVCPQYCPPNPFSNQFNWFILFYVILIEEKLEKNTWWILHWWEHPEPLWKLCPHQQPELEQFSGVVSYVDMLKID